MNKVIIECATKEQANAIAMYFENYEPLENKPLVSYFKDLGLSEFETDVDFDEDFEDDALNTVYIK